MSEKERKAAEEAYRKALAAYEQCVAAAKTAAEVSACDPPNADGSVAASFPPNPGTVAREIAAGMDLPYSTPVFGPDPSLNLIVPGTLATGFPYWLTVPGDPVHSVTATAQGLTLSLTARRSQVVYELGDGVTVQCGATTPWSYANGYDAKGAPKPSPTCGYRYQQPGTYTIRATVTWTVDWSGAGQNGSFAFTDTATITHRVVDIDTRIDR